MLSILRRYFPLFFVTGAFVAVVILYLRLKNPPAAPPSPAAVAEESIPDIPQIPGPTLSPLAETPDWKSLAPYQETITRDEFERLLTTVFALGDAWKESIKILDTNAIIETENEGIFILRFAKPGASPVVPPRSWRATSDLPPAPPDRPLEGIHIAIDAGHIGGDWAKMEERWFTVGEGKPVTEGDMTLLVAKLLKPKLEALGARISLVRETAEPVTPLRPDSLASEAETSAPAASSPESLQRLAQRLFYRTAEIRERARIVNETLKPDLVLCLHFNAEAWGDPLNPTLVPGTHLHLILNGAYNSDEISLADQRFTLVQKILQHIHEEEASVGATVADTFAEISKLPPYQYQPGNFSVLPVNGHPYLWARNLLANRLYQCPVIYMEPYVMNSVTDYARIQAGDYEGLLDVAGEMRPSIFREYADALTEGLRRHYSENRRK